MALFGHFDVRVDPWHVDYGSELPVDTAEEPLEDQVTLDVEVPADRWHPIVPRATSGPERLIFVDGVRRIEARLIVRRGEHLYHGAFGSCAVGWVELVTGRASWGEEHVRRFIALGSGEALPSEVRVTSALIYEPTSAQKSDADAPLRAIQNGMRAEEGALARKLANTPGSLIVADGPLTLSESSEGVAVGYVKRMFSMYLPRTHLDVMPRLPVGARTPLFALPTPRLGRYSWYVRLARPMAADSPFAGIARLEISATIDAGTAGRLADATALVLPRLAPSRGRDPRAPQNLFPIGALEWRLRRRLGDARLVRRQIESLVTREASHG